MKRPYPRIFARDFDPHPDDAEAVHKLAEKRKHTKFKLDPKGRVWSVSLQCPSDLDCGIIFKLPHLVEFNTGHLLGRSSVFTHLGFAKLCKHARLRAIMDCYNPLLGDEAAKAVGNSTRLRWVHLGGCGVTDKGVRNICKAKQLIMLSIFASEITEDVAENLAKLTNLRRINIHETKISIDSAIRLQKHLTRCTIDILLPKHAG